MRRKSPTSCLLGALLIAPAAFAQGAASGQAIHRCIGAHGEIVFSGIACAAGTSANAPPVADPAAPILSNETCATSREALHDRLGAAIARHDPNALASLLRWRGIGTRAASERLRALRDLVQRPLLAIDAGDAGNGAETADDTFRVRTGSNESDGVREHRFGVELEGACYWLLW